jgi:hypothetical protein
MDVLKAASKRAWCFALVSLVLLPELALGEPHFDTDVLPYIRANCVGCHGPEKQKGGFRIDELSPKVGLENAPQWAEVIERINSGEMPPKKVPKQPTAAENAAVVEWLATRMREGQAARMAKRGRVSYNRLTRDEYVNTVQDLIGVHFDATDPGGFSEDPEWHGFERIGSVMTLSPSNVEKYLAAGESILAEAYPESRAAFLEASRPAVPANEINEYHRERLRAMGLLDKVRFEMWAGDIYRGAGFANLPAPGIYEFQIKLSGLKPENGRAPRIRVYEKRLDRILFEQDIIAAEDKPITVTFRAHLPKGNPQIDVINDVPGLSNNFISGRHGDKPFVSTKEGRIPWQMKLTDEQGRPRHPFLILDSVAVRGPFITEREQQRRDEYWPHDPTDLKQVRAGLRKLADRAFRRPVRDEELDGFMGIVKAELAAAEKPRDAVKAGMLAVLCSKSFIFLAEGDEQENRGTLNDWETACRLSYLVWSTMPDDELAALASQGKLKDKAELARQLQRMLADSKSKRFSRSFPSQWLNLRKVGQFPPDRKLYPDYDKSLETSMVGETTAFFGEVLDSGLTLREFIDSRWTMANSRLARFYGITDTQAQEFTRVSLPVDSHRGGLLTQAAILSLTSDGTRHRPVHRGKWVMESVFGKSSPPPPANVEPIEPTPVDSPKATLRMRLDAHIRNPNCASCHQKLDPLGLAFDNFDAIGRWRTREVVEGTGDNPPVDASGTLPDGRTFKTPEEFKQLLLADIDSFNRAFVEKLATYGLRRTMSFEDGEDLKALAGASREKGYRLRDILEAFVTSDLFSKR